MNECLWEAFPHIPFVPQQEENARFCAEAEEGLLEGCWFFSCPPLLVTCRVEFLPLYMLQKYKAVYLHVVLFLTFIFHSGLWYNIGYDIGFLTLLWPCMTLFEDWPLDLLTLPSSLPYFKKLGVGHIDLFIMFWKSQVGKFLFLKDSRHLYKI